MWSQSSCQKGTHENYKGNPNIPKIPKKKLCIQTISKNTKNISVWKQRKVKQASERDFRYQGIMRNLVRRYVTVEQRKTEGEGVTEDDVNEIKQDISAFRCELIEILKNSGMNTSTASGTGTGEPRSPFLSSSLLRVLFSIPLSLESFAAFAFDLSLSLSFSLWLDINGAGLEFKMLKTTEVQSSESNISIDKFYDLSF